MSSRPPVIVVFGAGSIGRSFIGQVFARGGWSVVFVDVDTALVEALNRERVYEVVIRRQGERDESIRVELLRAIDGRDRASVAAELAAADLAATCVGKAALPALIPTIAEGLRLRVAAGGTGLDLILAENDREAAATLRQGLSALLPEDFRLADRLGLVETSIGKMVPTLSASERSADPLRVYAEAYNELIVDRRGFLGALPVLPELRPVDNILAYVDRKLFVHNLGHAAVAYLGLQVDRSVTLIARALGLEGVEAGARRAMGEAARALVREYPAEFSQAGLEAHIDDLLARFANEGLGDSVYRVGRDLRRKLHRSDRIVGAALLCEGQGLPWEGIAAVFAAALRFDAMDETGAAVPGDLTARAFLEDRGIGAFLTEICALDGSVPADARVRAGLEAAVRRGTDSAV
ncbi:MAG TPA: mannitol-1-phosphate 5-dehydrogenase [Rectinemataceae bacterium]|nr:mannitol-1-phosphate 5-dehydrogenase [Rectinemataceae bacterium]